MAVATDELLAPSKKHSNTIERALSSIHSLLETDFFCVKNLQKDGSFRYLTQDPFRSEYLFDQKLFRRHAAFKSPEYSPEGFFLVDHIPDPDLDHSQRRFQEAFDFGQLLVFAVTDGEESTHYAFGSSQTEDITNNYLTNLPLIRKFISYFEETAGFIYKDNDPINIAEECGSYFYKEPSFACPSLFDPKAIELIKAIEPEYEKLLKIQELTPGERRTFFQFLRGMTAKQVATTLHRSPRTTEAYLTRIKSKLGFEKKSHMLKFYTKYLDLFI